jgi:hypothetical protein
MSTDQPEPKSASFWTRMRAQRYPAHDDPARVVDPDEE